MSVLGYSFVDGSLFKIFFVPYSFLRGLLLDSWLTPCWVSKLSVYFVLASILLELRVGFILSSRCVSVHRTIFVPIPFLLELLLAPLLPSIYMSGLGISFIIFPFFLFGVTALILICVGESNFPSAICFAESISRANRLHLLPDYPHWSGVSLLSHLTLFPYLFYSNVAHVKWKVPCWLLP